MQKQQYQIVASIRNNYLGVQLHLIHQGHRYKMKFAYGFIINYKTSRFVLALLQFESLVQYRISNFDVVLLDNQGNWCFGRVLRVIHDGCINVWWMQLRYICLQP